MSDLFNPKTIEKRSSEIKLTLNQKRSAEEWLSYLKDNKLWDEPQGYTPFANIILGDILGYDITPDFLKHEHKRIDFCAVNKSGKPFICFELKGTKTENLWGDQHRDNKLRETPRDQIWDYMGRDEIPYGILTNYRIFALFDRTRSYKSYYKFDFEDIRGKTGKLNEEKLKEFVAMFSRRFVEGGQIEALHNESKLEERNFTKEFYKLFHETRLMMIEEFKDNELSPDERIHYSQLYLNRLMFIFFAEGKGFVEKKFFWNRIKPFLQNELLCNNRSRISDEIRGLFSDLDNSIPKSIGGFNGGLFKEKIPEKASFKDLRNDDFFKNAKKTYHLEKKPDYLEAEKECLDRITELSPLIRNIILMSSYDFEKEVKVDILGHIFEHSITDLELLKEGQESKRKKEGIFYTPDYITEYICRNTIFPYLSKCGAKTTKELVNEYSLDINELEKRFNNIKILDPACGSGAFLIKALDILLEISKEITEFKRDRAEFFASGRTGSLGKGKVLTNKTGQLSLAEDKSQWNYVERARAIIENNIFGVDLNEESIEITKLSLFLKLANEKKKLPDLSSNIKRGNSLIDDKSVDLKSAFKWHDEFPDIFKNGGFDIVIGNPPYIFSREKINPNEKEYYISNYHSSLYQINTYLLFMERAIQLLRPSGNYGLIVPNAWLMVSSAKNLRKFLLKTSKIEEIINLEGYSFEGVNVETIILLAKKEYSEENQIKIYLNNGKIFQYSHSKEQNNFSKNEDFRFNIFSEEKEGLLAAKLISSTKPLENFALIKAGLQAYEVGKGNPKQTKEMVENRPYDYNYKYDETAFKYLDGKNVGRYVILWTGAWLRYGEHLAAPRTFDIFKGNKLIIREITGSLHRAIIATVSDETYLFNRSNIAVIEKEGSNISLKYILVLLNSTLMSYYFLKNTPKAVRQMFPKLILEDLRKFPIPEAAPSEQTPFIEKADIMLKLNKEFYEKKNLFLKLIKINFEAEGSKKLDSFYELSSEQLIKEIERLCKKTLKYDKQKELIIEFEKTKTELLDLKSQIESTDKEIDQMVYKLYGLTGQEISLIETGLEAKKA